MNEKRVTYTIEPQEVRDQKKFEQNHPFLAKHISFDNLTTLIFLFLWLGIPYLFYRVGIWFLEPSPSVALEAQRQTEKEKAEREERVERLKLRRAKLEQKKREAQN